MSSSSYMPRLDGVRALAIVFVLIEHFTRPGFFRTIGIGGIGVRLFFVLSGYLITRILLGYRQNRTAAGAAAKQFYWRRLLRLSPPYYAAIAIMGGFGIAGVGHTWWIHCLYLSNFYVLWVHYWYASSHLWSLSVEEQFYLLWFLVVLILPRRMLLPAILFCIIGGPAFRGITLLLGLYPLTAYVMLPAQMDALATGALLACLALPPREGRLQAALRDPRLLAPALAALVATYVMNTNSHRFLTLQPIPVDIAAASLISICADPAPNRLVDWLALAPVRHLGRISYAIYIFHQFIPHAIQKYLPGLHLRADPEAFRFLVLTGLSVLAAQLSWMLIERPARRWRELVQVPPRLPHPVSAPMVPVLRRAAPERPALSEVALQRDAAE